jgi:hypothetical protein
MKFFYTILFFLLFINFGLFANNYDYFKNSSWLCIEDSSIGYNWDSQNLKWINANYKLNKFIFKTTDDSNCWTDLKEEGSRVLGHVCGQNYDFGKDPLIIYNYYELYDPIGGDLHISGQKNISTNYDFKLSNKGNFILTFNVPGDVGEKGINSNGGNYKDSMTLSVGKCSKM